ncbi:MAG: glycine--tRNA ligase, partial [Acholeplasmataceae bacterium]|nr:glycine--tRNA ligase [Acholeplasmataceae bacterium]
TLESGDTRQVLRLHPALSPYKVAVLPLMKKAHAEQAQDIHQMLSKHVDAIYDETQNIGKRYRRQDAIGTYLCVTIDHETEHDQAVTVRNRDTMAQVRVKIDDLIPYIQKETDY